MANVEPRRPFSVSLLYAWMLFVGISNILGGIYMLVTRNSQALVVSGVTNVNEITAYGTALLIFGALMVVAASLLHQGKEWVRILIGIVASINLASGLAVAIMFTGSYQVSGIFSALFAGLVIYLLFNHNADAWFAEEKVYDDQQRQANKPQQS